MEAKVEKKPLGGTFSSWRLRLFRIRDRRLMYYKAECTEWKQCIPSKVKLTIDLAHLSSAAFHPKNNPKPNVLLIKHPKIGDKEGAGGGLLLRFNDKETEQHTMMSWLKVLTSWSADAQRNRIYVAVPSNFALSLWNVSSVLYEHPYLLQAEGIFRKETTETRVKHGLCNDLLYERVSIAVLKSDHNDIYLLANALKYLLMMLPSSLFGDHNYEELLEEVKPMNLAAQEQKQLSDDDMEQIPHDKLRKLKNKIDSLYFGTKYRYRYGLIALILHLLKQVAMNVNATRMSCYALAKLFAMCFESKQWQNNARLSNPANLLRSVPLMCLLIYHSYFLFPARKWRMEEVVVAENLEAKTMEMYHELKLTKKQKKNRLKKMGKTPPTSFFNAKSTINIERYTIPKYSHMNESNDDEKEGKSAKKKHPKKRGLAKLARYTSVDDMDVGAYAKRAHNTEITTGRTFKRDKKFEPIHAAKSRTSKHNQILSRSLSREMEVVPPPPPPPIHDDEESSVAQKLRKAAQMETPKMTLNNQWNTIHQSKIANFCEPCYYNDGLRECVYFICNSLSTSHQCWMYDMKQNQYQSFTQYPEYLKLHNFSVCMDVNKKRIFIVSGSTEFVEMKNVKYDDRDSEYLWGDYNVDVYCDGKYNKDKQQQHNLAVVGDDTASIFITSDICELHVVGGKLSNIHYKWDEYQHKMLNVYSFDAFSGIQGHRLLFVNNEWNKPLRNRLLLLGGYTKLYAAKAYQYTDEIYCCDVKDNKYEWNVFKALYSAYASKKEKVIKLPRKLAHFGAIIYKNLYVIIFGGRTVNDEKINDIYYLNLHSMKWKLSARKCPAKARGFYAIISKEQDVIHLFQKDSNKHYTIKAQDIIPAKECVTDENEQEEQYKMLKQSEQRTSASYIGRQANMTVLNPQKESSSSSFSSSSSSSDDDDRKKASKREKINVNIAPPPIEDHMPYSPPNPSPPKQAKKRLGFKKRAESAQKSYETYASLSRDSVEKPTNESGDYRNESKIEEEDEPIQYVTNTTRLPKTSIAKVREDIKEEEYKKVDSEMKDDKGGEDIEDNVDENTNKDHEYVDDVYRNNNYETAVESGGFSCNVLYGWFAGLCGLGSSQVQQTTDYRPIDDEYDPNNYDDGYDDYYDDDPSYAQSQPY